MLTVTNLYFNCPNIASVILCLLNVLQRGIRFKTPERICYWNGNMWESLFRTLSVCQTHSYMGGGCVCVARKTGREWKHRSEILLYMLSHFTILKRLKVAHNPHNILKMYKGVDRISSSPDDSGFAFCVLIAFVVHICLNPAKTSSGIEQWLFICFVLWYDMFTPFTLDLFCPMHFSSSFQSWRTYVSVFSHLCRFE